MEGYLEDLDMIFMNENVSIRKVSKYFAKFLSLKLADGLCEDHRQYNRFCGKLSRNRLFFFFSFILNFVLGPFIDIDCYNKILNFETPMVLKISLN